MPPHELNFKKGCSIMLLRNLALSQELCNGTRLFVTKLQWNFIEAKAIDSDNSHTFFIPRLPMIPLDSNIPFKYKGKQFPVMLTFCMTINKSQGQTLKKIYLTLHKPVFCHGELYVALSRVWLFQSAKVVAPSCSIYKEALDTLFHQKS